MLTLLTSQRGSLHFLSTPSPNKAQKGSNNYMTAKNWELGDEGFSVPSKIQTREATVHKMLDYVVSSLVQQGTCLLFHYWRASLYSFPHPALLCWQVLHVKSTAQRIVFTPFTESSRPWKHHVYWGGEPEDLLAYSSIRKVLSTLKVLEKRVLA